MESNSAGSSRGSGFKDEFIDLLFSWSIEDIFDKNLYKFQVEKIPESFDSVDHYLTSYFYPLLEETRTELASALETVYNAPYAEVTSFKELKHETRSYKVEVDRWENRISDGGKDPYRTLPGDFFLLSILRPESVSDLQRSGWTYTYASVVRIFEDESGDNSALPGFKLKTAGGIDVEDVESKPLYMVHLANITTQKRIWNALRMRRNLGIIKKVLTKDDMGQENCEICPLNYHIEAEEKFGSTLLSKLNESQRGSILATLRRIGCIHQPSVELIWGPPGTGKTLTLSILLYTLLKMNVRTLVCAPTNIAITELVSRVAALVRNSFKTESEKKLLSCPLGGMLIFGNKDNLKVGSDIQEILLDYRVERLAHFLVPLTGWKHCISTMLDFLEHCFSQYQVFTENEQIKSNDLPDDEVRHSVSQSFLEYARVRFTNVASSAKECLLTFFTHLPRSFIQEENYQSIVQLISLLDSLEMLLFEDSLKSSELETIFLQPAVIGPESFVDTSSLLYIRSRSCSILRSLQASLGDMLIFGNKDNLKVGSDIQEILLDYRVERLAHFLVPLTGWKHCISTMLDFLEHCFSQYQEFTKKEQIKSNDLPDDEVRHSVSQSFLEFARVRFTHAASSARECLLTFFTHLPRSFIQEENYQSIVQLISLLDSLEMLLFEDSLTSSELETIFHQKAVIGPESFVDTSSLLYIRSRSCSILRSLHASLSNLSLPLVNFLTAKTLTSEFCLQKASMIFCTTSSSYKLHSADIEPFHFLVIDEAAQVKECETCIALQLPYVKHAILVGDEYQLPATVNSKLSEEAGFGRSLFERLSSMGHSKHLLNMQYRMHPSISRFPNTNFYDNQILNAPNVKSKSYERCYLQGRMFGPYSFINVCDGREELDDVGRSRRNMVEVAVVLKLLRKLFKAWSISKEKLSIGLISPYAAQVAAIRDKLQTKYDNFEGFSVKVKSIDGFQGGEEDVIIISTVRSNRGGSIGFLSSPQRTNVALTRARHCLWILGNERTLVQSDSVWEALIYDAKNRQRFFNADEDCDIGKTIVDAKKEFHQLDDFLSAESVLFQNSRWQVLFSDDFRKSLKKLTSSTKKLVIHLLLKLASGWRPKKINVDKKCLKSSYILKQFKVDNYYVVCSIDIIKESIYKQVLKVWDISHFPMVETTELFKRLDSIASMYTDDFINHCNDKLFEGNLEIPKSWACSSDIIRFKSPNNTKGASASNADCRSYTEDSKVNESLLLMKFYNLSIGTVNHLLSDLDGTEFDLPFEVTDEEREIIVFPKTSFILGRSGTGKTTVLVMKLYQKIQQYCIASRYPVADDKANVDHQIGESSGTNLHQLFVTVSPKLCHVVKKHVFELKSFATENISGCNFTGVDDSEEIADFKDIPDTFVGIQSEKYPLIITFHKFLMMLDGSLGNSYFQRFQDVRGSTHYDGRRSIALQTFMRKNEVTYDRFQSFYWPRFNKKLTKNLNASRVFTEIMSHIKGGTKEGDCMRSREAYVSLSESRVSTLSADTRSVIYDIFQDYERKKLNRSEFDLADFVNDIHLRLKNEDLLGDKMAFVYIDEVQDLSMSQISLFRYICKNVDDGFVFSGDTAQTIAKGIDFRFEDIRSLFYNEFLMKSRHCDVSGRRDKGLISDMFTLSQNFRTHTGVLKLAQSVIDLICYYFPLSIDSLPPETSLVYGESPIVLDPRNNENLIISIFRDNGKDGAKWAGFGADQVILVRDDIVKKEILSCIGHHQATILTIVECKGLEFQDVLLYDFFGSSPLSDQWRVVYEFFNEKDSLKGDSQECFPSFNQSRHNILCSELKQLYVAITRAKQRLWICENNAELSKPMLDYWKSLCLVQVKKLDDSLAEAMQTTSSHEEWKSQGVKLFWEKNYEMAIMCFEKASEEMWEKRARASALKAASQSLRHSNSEEANVMLKKAAEIFDSIDRVESAAECFCDLGDYKRAGRIYFEKCGMSELRKAGECFYLAGSYKTAAKVYAKGNFFKECLSCCTKGKYFDLGLQYIEHWKEHASFNSDVSYLFLENCALESYKAKDIASVMKFVRCFHSFESKRNFLKSVGCLEELLALEEESGNFNEAAEIARSIGEVLREIDLLEKAGQFSDACLLILSYVLSNSLWMHGNRGWPMRSFPQKAELLDKAILFAQKVSENFHALICPEVEIMLHNQSNITELMQCYYASKQNDTPICELFYLRKVLDEHFQVNPKKYLWDPELHLCSRSFDGRILWNQVSAGTLVYLWNLWKEQSFKIVKCLDGLEKKLHFIKSEGVVRLCFSYFGVRLVDNFSATLLLLNPDAAWLREVDIAFVRRNRKSVALELRYFTSAARKFCYQDLVYVGCRVLTALQALYRSSVAKGMPKYYRSMCLLHIFDIANYFLESRSIAMMNADVQKMQGFLQLSTKYFDLVFPLDPRDSLSKHMIGTQLSRKLLEEIVCRNISTRGELTHGQMEQNLILETGNEDLQIKWGLIRETSDAFESLRNQIDENSKILVLTKKVEVQKHIKLLTTAVAQIAVQRSHSGEDISLLCEAIALIKEMNAFLSLLVPRDFDVKAMTDIGQVFKRFEARKPQLDMLLSKCSVVFEEIYGTKISDGKRDDLSEAEWTLCGSKKGKGPRM